MIVRRQLERLEEEGRPIRLGIVGCGAMGAGTLDVISGMAGIKPVVLADLDVERALAALAANGIARDQVVVSSDRGRCCDAIERGTPLVTDDGLIVRDLPLDVVLEATGSTAFGAEVAHHAIEGGHHVVMLTVETDVVVGPILARAAQDAGVVYTLASGDQPGAILELYHWARSLGFEVLAAGRGNTLYPEDRFQGPHDERRGRIWISNSPRMINSFRDGTKSQIEMAAVSNATGLLPDVRGMHEPQVAVSDLARVFSLKEDGGVLAKKGVVEIANSVTPDGVLVTQDQVGLGVFVVIDSPHPGVRQFLRQSFASQGEHGAALYRPYHMTCLEVPMSIARAGLLGVATAAPIGMFTEVVAVAKRDLAIGEVLDGGGGETVYARVERAEVATNEGLLPFGFAEGIPLTRSVRHNQPIRTDDVNLRSDSFLVGLRKRQDNEIGFVGPH